MSQTVLFPVRAVALYCAIGGGGGVGWGNRVPGPRRVGLTGAQGGLCGGGRGGAGNGATPKVGATRGDCECVSRHLTAGTLSVRFLDGDLRLPVLRLRRAA